MTISTWTLSPVSTFSTYSTRAPGDVRTLTLSPTSGAGATPAPPFPTRVPSISRFMVESPFNQPYATVTLRLFAALAAFANGVILSPAAPYPVTTGQVYPVGNSY